MTDEMIRAREEQLIAAIAVVLTHPLSFSVEMLGDVMIRRMPDGQIHVSSYRIGFDDTEDKFDDLRQAINFFLDMCDEQGPKPSGSGLPDDP
jgi:hypothetical protein